MQLEFCGRLRCAGCNVEFIRTDDRAHPPDARVHIAGRWVTVEFKALHGPGETLVWDLFVGRISDRFVQRMHLSEVEVDLEPNALDELDAVVEGLIAVKRNRSTEMQELPRRTGRARFTGLNVGHWCYPISERPALHRVLGKLPKWSQKFRHIDGPALLLVRAEMLVGPTAAGMLERAEQLASRLREALERFPRISAVIVYDDAFQVSPDPAFFDRSGFRLQLGAIDGWARAVLLVQNTSATSPLEEPELRALAGPDMLW
jgi:hypothetical protein